MYDLYLAALLQEMSRSAFILDWKNFGLNYFYGATVQLHRS